MFSPSYIIALVLFLQAHPWMVPPQYRTAVPRETCTLIGGYIRPNGEQVPFRRVCHKV